MATPDARRAKVEAAGAERMAVDGDDDDTAPRRDDRAGAVAAMPARDKLRDYYARLFPTQQMYKWLAYGNDGRHAASDPGFFNRREICFTLDGDIFARYQSFQNASDLGAALVQRVPSKVDVGPVYTHDPRQRAKYAKTFRPVMRELVFDVDLTDYDDVRTCGKEGHICGRCWPLMAAAVAVVDAALRSDFGFQHLLWVFSGRRGVHCWVADEGARALADDVRGAVVSYLSVFKGVEGGRVKLGFGVTRHPAVERAYEALKDAWRERILPAQRLLEDADAATRVLAYVPDDELTSNLRRAWERAGWGAPGGDETGDLSVARWDELSDEVEAKAARVAKSGNRGRAAALLKGLAEAVMAHSYPRLDVEVSKKMNHLLKAPFCVHPKTGKVCVPIDPAAAWEFDVDAVPTLDVLTRELGDARRAAAAEAAAAAARGGGGDGDQGGKATAAPELWRSTSLASHIRYFEDAFLAPLASAHRAALNAKARDQAEARRAADLSW